MPPTTALRSLVLPLEGHETLTLVSPGIIEVVQDGHQDVQHVTALQDVKQELLQGGDQEGVRAGATLHPWQLSRPKCFV